MKIYIVKYKIFCDSQYVKHKTGLVLASSKEDAEAKAERISISYDEELEINSVELLPEIGEEVINIAEFAIYAELD